MSEIRIYPDDIKFKPECGDMYLSISIINGMEIKAKQKILSALKLQELVKEDNKKLKDEDDYLEPDDVALYIRKRIEESECLQKHKESK